MGWVSHCQCVRQLMMTYYVETPEIGVSILSDGVGKPFSVRLAADDDRETLFLRNLSFRPFYGKKSDCFRLKIE